MNSGGQPSRRSQPLVELQSLEELWFQVSGTLCNLSCTHCFISCNPKNDSFGFLDLETVRRYLAESRALGVKEYYFTGGEPFLNHDMLPILDETLQLGPASVLTNATVFRGNTIAELRRITQRSSYSLEIRVSIDGYEAAMNDPLRGKGTFAAAMKGVDQLVEAGFLPIITMVQTWPEEKTLEVFTRFAGELRRRGYSRPRIKILPALRIGMEESRTHGYLPEERITTEMMEGYDPNDLLCSHSRIVTDRGVAVCPILIEAPGAHLGKRLADSLQPFPVVHSACYTCYLYGTICANTGATLGADR